MKKLLFGLICLLFSFDSFSYYLPSRNEAEVAIVISHDINNLLDIAEDIENFDVNKFSFSAHLLKKQINEKFDMVSNFYLAHKKGVAQVQLTYHLCCEGKDVVFVSMSSGISSDIKAHGGLGIEIYFNNLVIFGAGTHRKDFRVGSLYHIGEKKNFGVGLITDFFPRSDGNGYSKNIGLYLSLRIDSRGQETIEIIKEKLSSEVAP